MSKNSRSRRVREPEVIVFEEPQYASRTRSGKQAAREREKFLAGNVAEIFADVDEGQSDKEERRGRGQPTDREGQEGNGGIDIKATLREVQALAASSLSGKEKRKFEREQVIALGGKPPKPQRMPYPVYQRVTKARREKEERVNEELRLSQMAPRKKKGEERKFRGKGRWKDTTKSLDLPVGKFKGGVLTLTQKDITKISRTKR